MSIVNKHTLWVYGGNDDIFTAIRNKRAIQVTLDLFGDGNKDKYIREEIDYLTSGFKSEKDLIDHLRRYSLFVTPNSHVGTTHQLNGLRTTKLIYDNEFIHQFSEEVVRAKKKGKENAYYLEDGDGVYDFVQDILGDISIEFLLACKKEIISPGLMYLFTEYARLDRDIDSIQRYNVSRQIEAFCRNYRTVRKLVYIKEDVKRTKHIDTEQYGYLNPTMYTELFVQPIQDIRLRELYNEGGIENVFKNMQPIELFACSANDLRKIGVLPLRFTAWEYRAFQKAHPEIIEPDGPILEVPEDEDFDPHIKPINDPHLAEIYEKYQNDYEELFNNESIDNIYGNPENFDDLVAMGLIPEGTRREDVFYEGEKPSKK